MYENRQGFLIVTGRHWTYIWARNPGPGVDNGIVR